MFLRQSISIGDPFFAKLDYFLLQIHTLLHLSAIAKLMANASNVIDVGSGTDTMFVACLGALGSQKWPAHAPAMVGTPMSGGKRATLQVQSQWPFLAR